MNNLIDITHTVKASSAPSEGARYMFDPATGERYWVETVEESPVPELTVPVEESPAPPEGFFEGITDEPDPEVPPVPMPTPPKSKR